MNIALTFDLEKDANLSSTYGILIGLKKILIILRKYTIRSTFFVTSYIAQQYPKLIRDLSKNNEIGSHGYDHRKYIKVGEIEKKKLGKAKLLLEKITGKEVLGFRAPNLYTNLQLYKALKELNFVYDASGKPNSKLDSVFGLKIFKVSNFNVYFRFPFGKTYFISKCLQNKNSLTILYFHPWEAVDMKRLYLKRKSLFDLIYRPDRWIRTGASFLANFNELIKYFIARNYKFRLLKELL